jgi:deoxyribodipyrimidine photo-lyase
MLVRAERARMPQGALLRRSLMARRPTGDAPVNDVPDVRVRGLSAAGTNPRGGFVLYWMSAARRARWNFGLQRAVQLARALDRPLVVLEGLECGGRWDSERFHRFVLEGMADNARRLEATPALYYPFVEQSPGEAEALLMSLGAQACAIVADDFPAPGVPEALSRVAREAGVLLEAVDSNGLLPMRAADRVFPTAYAFRRFLQAELPSHLGDRPSTNPLARVKLPSLGSLPARIQRRWPKASPKLLRGDESALAPLPIGHGVTPVSTPGGGRAAEKVLARFLKERLARYAAERNEPEHDVTSELSPYLHYGHISAHHVFAKLMKQEQWSPDDLAETPSGSRRGWWGVSEAPEAFLDQLVTWRELGFNMAWQRSDHVGYDSLPDWAKQTLADHAADMRPHVYSVDELEAGKTHDPLWNAAQMQLVREGRLHNYLRMLWGKKILEWTPAPQEAAEVMVELNNKYALDGQDPNSYSGIFWVLGRYDRAWGPERPIFGKIRYMSSENTARKVRVKEYIRKYAP